MASQVLARHIRQVRSPVTAQSESEYSHEKADTALECIAEYARRPLMTLSTSDIGTTPSEVEENLEHHFKRAKSWGAILLIDEADVYLERRSVSDLRRNGLVAGWCSSASLFSRAMSA